jgi:hypothetical protein
MEMMMKKLIIAASTVSLLVFGASVSAEQRLSAAEMDGVTAAGFAEYFASARARGVESSTEVETYGDTYTVDTARVPGQVGGIDVVRSEGGARTYAYARGSFAEADGYVEGDTEGTLASDTYGESLADADTTGALRPGSRVSAYSYNYGWSDASEIVLGRTASANSSAGSFAIIGN